MDDKNTDEPESPLGAPWSASSPVAREIPKNPDGSKMPLEEMIEVTMADGNTMVVRTSHAATSRGEVSFSRHRLVDGKMTRVVFLILAAGSWKMMRNLDEGLT